MKARGMPARINDEIFIAMGKALDFLDPERLSMTVVLTAMNRYALRPTHARPADVQCENLGAARSERARARARPAPPFAASRRASRRALTACRGCALDSCLRRARGVAAFGSSALAPRSGSSARRMARR
jgi:hypothetical protein